MQMLGDFPIERGDAPHNIHHKQDQSRVFNGGFRLIQNARFDGVDRGLLVDHPDPAGIDEFKALLCADHLRIQTVTGHPALFVYDGNTSTGHAVE